VSRIDDLRRRLQQDPASIAFAQLAEEHRRAGDLADAIRVCREGLSRHPTYASARITLARALAASGEPDAAQAEFEIVRRQAPDNLAALRGLADLFQGRGALKEALAACRAALKLARHDPDLQATVTSLEQTLGVTDDRPRRTLAVLEGWLEVVRSRRQRPEA
jgi:tetratricopeptide (TPR) repeat protein